MVNVQKRCWNVHHDTSILFTDHFQVNWVRKSLCYSYAKSWECFLTHWLPIKRILLLKKDNFTIPILIQLSQKETFFLTFLLDFWNLQYILNILKQKMILIDFVFPKLRSPKTWWDKCLKSSVSEEPSTTNMVNIPKHCWNLNYSTFIRFIDHFHVNWVGKRLSYWHAKS